MRVRSRWTAAASATIVAATVAATVAIGGAPAGAATKSAFVIGFMNGTSGPAPYPGISDGAQAAAQYVNAHGGINGHPLVLAVCEVDATPEKNAACGNQFANDPRLKMINTGATLLPAPFYSAIAPTGLPILQSFPIDVSEYLVPNAVSYSGGSVASLIGQAEIANNDKAKTVARIYSDSPVSVSFTNFFKARYKVPGGTSTTVYPAPTTTDALPYLLQSGAANADLVVLGFPNCLPFAKAIAQLGIPGTKVVSFNPCMGPANVQGPNGALFEGWRSASIYQDPLLGPVTPDLKTLINEYPKYAKLPTTPTLPSNVAYGWGPILTLQKVLAGQPDSVLNNKKALFNVLHSYTGPANLAGPVMKCGQVKTLPTACSLWTMKTQVRGGKYFRVAG